MLLIKFVLLSPILLSANQTQYTPHDTMACHLFLLIKFSVLSKSVRLLASKNKLLNPVLRLSLLSTCSFTMSISQKLVNKFASYACIPIKQKQERPTLSKYYSQQAQIQIHAFTQHRKFDLAILGYQPQWYTMHITYTSDWRCREFCLVGKFGWRYAWV